MQPLVYNPKTKRESLQDFNARLQEFCAEVPVVSVNASTIGSALILSLLTADDAGHPGQATVTVVVRKVDSEAVDLEEHLIAMIEHAEELGTEEAPNEPVGLITVERKDKPGEGWAVLLCVNGEVGPPDGEELTPDDEVKTEIEKEPAVGFAPEKK